MCELPPPRRGGGFAVFFWVKKLVRLKNADSVPKLDKKNHGSCLQLPKFAQGLRDFHQMPQTSRILALPKFSELGRQTVGFLAASKQYCLIGKKNPPYTTSLGDGYWRCVKSRLGVKKRKLTYSKTYYTKTCSKYTFPKLQPC